MKMIPRVSVCIPAYKQPEFTARAVASVFSQTFQDFEVIITDDSESDEVAEAISPWRNDARMVYCRNKTRLGSPENWNATMQLARSDLIKFLHHDDWFATDDALERFVSAIENHPEIDFAFSSANACEDDGSLIFVHKPNIHQIELLRERPWELQFANFIGAPSTTIFRRKQDFKFDIRFRWVVDIEAYLRLLGAEPSFEYIPDALVCISSNGKHQVTQSVAENPVSGVLEHLKLYDIHRPQSLYDRIKGFLFILHTVAILDVVEMNKINLEYSFNKFRLEEKIALFLLRFKSIFFSRILTIKNKIHNILFKFYSSPRKSYSQCGEDMIIDFLLMWLGVERVTYLDIGANHPTWLSNTYHFYRNGHSGILIEPDIDLCQRLSKKRPRDKVLNLAVGIDGEDTIPMYIMTSRTLNTLDKEQAETLQNGGYESIEEIRMVKRLGINLILAEYFSNTPDIVSLDIEGLDFLVLQAWDFSRFRPKIFCVETITYTRDNTEQKLTDIIDYMIARRYKVYADTFINTIFVCQDAWDARPVSV